MFVSADRDFKNISKKDPWGGEQQPPDLDEALRQLRLKFRRFLGMKPPINVGATGGRPLQNFNVVYWIIGGIFLLYLLSGIFIVKPAEQAAIFRFGRYIETVWPGPHWIPRFVETTLIENVDRVLFSKHSNRMLTSDENIVSIELTVQYRINDLEKYLFNAVNPHYSLQEATDSAIRQVVGSATLDDVLTEKRAEIRNKIEQQLQAILDIYQLGLKVEDVNLQPAKAPDEVKEAFDDAIKALEDEERLVNEAYAYERRVVPIAEGKAQRVIAEAQAYAAEVKLQAEADTSRFERLLPEYQKAPLVTRQRLYLETMEGIFKRVNKVVVDTDGRSLFYVPLEQLFNGAASRIQRDGSDNPGMASQLLSASQDKADALAEKVAARNNPPEITGRTTRR